MAPGCYGCSGCYGCCGYVSVAPVYGVPAAPLMKPADEGKTNDKGMVMQPATVVVKAASDVQIKVNGQATTRRATEETYTTPVLDPSKTYTYVFVAEQTADGRTRSATKQVTVEAGKETVVDFSDFAAAVATTEATAAKVTVIMPGKGKVYVNDVEIAVSGKKTFHTPKLVKGQRYFYTVKADLVKDGKTTTDTRRVDVEAGKAVTIDFSAPAVLTASR